MSKNQLLFCLDFTIALSTISWVDPFIFYMYNDDCVHISIFDLSYTCYVWLYFTDLQFIFIIIQLVRENLYLITSVNILFIHNQYSARGKKNKLIMIFNWNMSKWHNHLQYNVCSPRFDINIVFFKTIHTLYWFQRKYNWYTFHIN